MKIIIFLPCRRGSERVKSKNTKSFAGITGGLAALKLRQLIQLKQLVDCVDSIVVSTDDPEVMSIAENAALATNTLIRVVPRPTELALSSTSTDELIKYVPQIVPADSIILWTHVTSPFINAACYGKAIAAYHSNVMLGAFDSLMSVSKLQKFLWDDQGPINYSKTFEKWPRTQTLQPIYCVNSGFFISNSHNYRMFSDRIGKKPNFFELSEIESFDIDWETDFEMAELLYNGLNNTEHS